MNKVALKWSAFAVVTAFSLCFYWLLFTTTGLNWFIEKKFSSDQYSLTLNNVNHSWFSHTSIENLEYLSPLFNIKLHKIQLKWNPLTLFNELLHIQEINIEKSEITIKKAIKSGAKQRLIPLETKIESGNLRNLTYISLNRSKYTFGKIDFQKIYISDSIIIPELKLHSQYGYTNVSGKISVNSGEVINISTNSHLKFSSLPVLNIYGTIVGTPAQLRFMQTADAPYKVKLNGRIKNLLYEPSIVVNANVNEIRLDKINPGLIFTTATGKISGDGPINNVVVNSKLQLADSYENLWQVSGEGTFQSNTLAYNIGAQIKDKRKFKKTIVASGNYTFENGLGISRALNINASWDKFELPAKQKTVLKSSSGTMKYSGDSMKIDFYTPDFYYNAFGAELKHLKIKSDGVKNNKVSFLLNANSDTGNLALEGDFARISKNNFRMQNISFNGENFPLLNKTKMQLLVSPTMNFARKNSAWIPKGFVHVPSANIQLDEINTIAVFLNTIQGLNKKLNLSTYNKKLTKIKIELGDSVWFRGYGLNAHVSGKFAISNSDKKELLGYGELQILKGNYKLGNRRVPLKGGNISFNHSAMDNPEVELSLIMSSQSLNEPKKISGKLKTLYKDSYKLENNEAIQDSKIQLLN